MGALLLAVVAVGRIVRDRDEVPPLAVAALTAAVFVVLAVAFWVVVRRTRSRHTRLAGLLPEHTLHEVWADETLSTELTRLPAAALVSPTRVRAGRD